MKKFAKKTMNLPLVGGILLLIFSACDHSYLETEKWPDYELQPVVATPLVNASLSIMDLIAVSDTNLIVVGNNQLISLVYRDTVKSSRGDAFYQFPNQQFTSGFTFAPPGGQSASVTFTRSFSFSTGLNDRLDSIKFLNGNFSLLASAPGLVADGYQGMITITILGSYNNLGQQFTMRISADGNISGSLRGYTIPFYSQGGTHNIFDVQYHVAVSGAGVPNNAPYTLTFTKSFSGMVIERAFGALAERVNNLGEIGFGFGVLAGNLTGRVSFEDPKLRFTALNSFGLPMQITASSIRLFKNNTQMSVVTGFSSPWLITAPGLNQIGQTSTTLMVLNRQNSNIREAFASLPDNIHTGVSARLNPGGGGPVFVTNRSQLDVAIEIELPFHGIIEGLTLSDTLNLIRNDSITEIEWIELRVEVLNHFPFDVNLQLEFADVNNRVQMILWEGTEFQNIVGSAIVDNYGRVIAPQSKTTTIKLNPIRINAFLNSNNLIIKARLNSANQAQTPVRILNDQTLDVQIGARIKGRVRF